MVEIGTFDLEPGEVKITTRSRGVLRQVYEQLRVIVDEGHRDPGSLGKLRAVATFDLVAGEKHKASELKSNLTKRLGTDSTYAGFRFVIVRNVEGTEEYLAVVYDPRKIVAGKYEKRERERRARYEAYYARQQKREGNGE